MDETVRCKRFGGFCDDFNSVEDLSGLHRGKSFPTDELEAFTQRFLTNSLQIDEQISYNIWVADSNNPDPSDFKFDSCPLHKEFLIRLIYGQVTSDRNEYYCFENCVFGESLLKTTVFNHYINIIYAYLSGCSETFSLYTDKDILRLMEQAEIPYTTEEEWEDELFFVKQCISSFYSGQMKGMSDNREAQDKEREEKQKQQQETRKK